MVNVILCVLWDVYLCFSLVLTLSLLERMIDSVWLELFSNETVRLKEVLAGTEKMESPTAEVNETSPSGVCKS